MKLKTHGPLKALSKYLIPQKKVWSKSFATWTFLRGCVPMIFLLRLLMPIASLGLVYYLHLPEDQTSKNVDVVGAKITHVSCHIVFQHTGFV